ncbi:hypothetical protein R5R35_006330 [Gryllus longicercus]|uniref:THAP-type domain-containing protein n=1 Tax=Gryllus longicercus TaxID=2509291 RepID=A0AAN9VIG6_9ORTH
MPRSRRNCCIVNCHNTEENCAGTGIKFYSFPSRPYQQERRRRWIEAIQRMNSDGSPWVPSQHSRVCSEHFVGGTISSSERHPSYIPTVFAPSSLRGTQKKRKKQKKISVNSFSDSERGGICAVNENLDLNTVNKSKGNDIVDMEDIDIDFDDIEEIEFTDIEEAGSYAPEDVVDQSSFVGYERRRSQRNTSYVENAIRSESTILSKSVQVDLDINSSFFEFTCCFDNGNVGTQCSVVNQNNLIGASEYDKAIIENRANYHLEEIISINRKVGVK